MDIPAGVAASAERIGDAIAGVVPRKSASNLLIATWNLRAFGGLTEKWGAAAKDSPKRDQTAVVLIAAVLARFDVIAIQEVRRDTKALRFLLEVLGPKWKVIVSDVTEGDEGNDERLTYLYDTKRVAASGLVGELVLPPAAGNPERQFARTPYAASFTRKDVEFILTTVHVIWGGSVADRLPEMTAFAKWMRAWADRPNDWNENLLVLGDFNIDRRGSGLYQAFASTGLRPPSALFDVPRTVFDGDKKDHFYDQIAWFTHDQTAVPKVLLDGMGYTGNGGYFDFLPHVYPSLTKNEVSWRISDHYPLWVEFGV